ncbi:hypothetical protein V1291_001147 [Nitrobacteraceae bacterium AZCC 1564]
MTKLFSATCNFNSKFDLPPPALEKTGDIECEDLTTLRIFTKLMVNLTLTRQTLVHFPFRAWTLHPSSRTTTKGPRNA